MERLYEDRAWLYDIAFSWDVEQEVQWLLERFGGTPRRVLEPGCGSGRLMPAFAQHGVDVIGIDRSPVMLDRARDRMKASGFPRPQLVLGDMAGFNLDVRCDGALCPINTFAYLDTEQAARRHLACVAAHLRPAARYLVQLDLNNAESVHAGGEADWEATTPEGRVRCRWFGRSYDPATKIQVQVSRFEVLGGPQAGAVFEDVHRMRVWSWNDWQDLIGGSEFRQVAAYDASRRGLEAGPQLEGRNLIWHELQRS